MSNARYEIRDVTIEPDRRCVRINWADDHESRFHFVWLRHSEFFSDVLSTDRVEDCRRLPDDPSTLSVTSVDVTDDSMILHWGGEADDTTYAVDWLRNNCYADESRALRRHQPVLWNGDDGNVRDRFDWQEIERGNGEKLFELFLSVRDYGFAKVFNVPTDEGSVAEAASRFGPVMTTHLGQVFDVKLQPGFNIGATQANYIGPHTDDNWRYAPIGISFFHCLKAHPSGGGYSLLVDGFLAATRLRKNNPDAFDFLNATPILFRSYRNEGEKYCARRKMINTDQDGNIIGVRFTARTLAPQDMPEHLIEPAYTAVRAFAQEIYNPDLEQQYLMQPGDMHVIDNHRILHGRGAFEANTGERHLQHCSVPRDEFHNTLRIAAHNRGMADEFLLMADGAIG